MTRGDSMTQLHPTIGAMINMGIRITILPETLWKIAPHFYKEGQE
jgi:hypothetical protein